jgi:hypothetical protein
MNEWTDFLVEHSRNLRRNTLKLLQTVPEDRHNWRPHADSLSFAEIAWFLHLCDQWFAEKVLSPDKAIFPEKSIQHYDRQERLFVLSVLELDRSQEQRQKLLESVTAEMLSQKVFDERFGETTWLQVIIEGYLEIEVNKTGRIESYLEIIR